MLIVDDDPAARKALSLIFEKKGFTTISAENGEEGLTDALKEKPDVIILDIVMPVMNGVKMLEKLRASPEGKTVPVIIITNSDIQNLILEPATKDAAVIMIKTNWSLENIAEEVMSVLKLS